jgi:RHS repeat-associated protein
MRNYSEIYSYDAVGNISSVVHQATNGNWTRTYLYDEPNVPYTNNRLTGTKVGALAETYKYNANGDMILMPQLSVMNWDFKDQLQATSRQAVVSGTPETTYYGYDSSGQRVRKVTDAAAAAGVVPVRSKERIYLGAFEIYREYGSDGTTLQLERQTLHITDDKRRGAMVETKTIDNGQKIASPVPLARYQFDNHLGTSCLELDDSAKIISYEEYYPYGSTSYQAVDQSIQVSAKRYRYIGKERDEETGLYYYGARYYAPWIGKWTSADPTGTRGGLNLYAYCVCEPIGLSDMDGRAPNKELQAVLSDIARYEKQGRRGQLKIAEHVIPHKLIEYLTRLDPNDKSAATRFLRKFVGQSLITDKDYGKAITIVWEKYAANIKTYGTGDLDQLRRIRAVLESGGPVDGLKELDRAATNTLKAAEESGSAVSAADLYKTMAMQLGDYGGKAAFRVRSAEFLTQDRAALAAPLKNAALEAAKVSAASKGAAAEEEVLSKATTTESKLAGVGAGTASDVGLGGLQDYGTVQSAAATDTPANTTLLQLPAVEQMKTAAHALTGGGEPKPEPPPVSA